MTKRPLMKSYLLYVSKARYTFYAVSFCFLDFNRYEILRTLYQKQARAISLSFETDKKTKSLLRNGFSIIRSAANYSLPRTTGLALLTWQIITETLEPTRRLIFKKKAENTLSLPGLTSTKLKSKITQQLLNY